MKTSLGIWALGPMVTRFVPGGYQPQWASETTVERVRRAVEGLGDLIDGYEFHYPQELNAGNVDEVRGALDGHDVYCLATGLHLDPRFGKGGLVSPDPATRNEAVRRTLEAIDFSGELGAHFIIWPGIEGYNYPFQTPYADSWAWLVDGIGQAAERCRDHGILLFLEHKNSEPAMKILMRNIGMTLHVIHKLRAQGIDNVKVNMDWQHLLMNGENLGEYAALLAAEGLLGHQHANSGWGTFDDDNMVGATAFMETLELAVELRRAGYGENGERLGFDLYPYTEDAVAAVRRSVLHWRFIDSVAVRIDDSALREAQMRKDAVRAYELVYAALSAERARSSASTSARPASRRSRSHPRARSSPPQRRSIRSRCHAPDGRSRIRRTGCVRARRRLRALASERSAWASRARCTVWSASTPGIASSDRRSSGTTSAPRPSAPRSRSASASSD
jgi:xylose isomerase